MSLINKLIGTEAIKNQLFSKMANEAKKQGVTQLIITIKEDGNFETETIKKEDGFLITKKSFSFLHSLFQKSKLPAYQDTIKP